MNRLIRAEWYRVRHSSNFMKWLMVLCAVCVLFPMLVDIEVVHGNLTENWTAQEETLTVFMTALLSVFSALIVGVAYMNKTAYYEVMAGNKIYQIAFSKVLVDAVLVSGTAFVFMGIYWTVIGVCNGIGEIDRLVLRLCLLFLVFFHACTCGILIVTSFRQILGTVLVYLRLAGLETLALFLLRMFGEGLPGQTFAKISDWFTMVKLTKILRFEYEITNHLIFAVIAGFLIESAVWFGISYLGMKRQSYK